MSSAVSVTPVVDVELRNRTTSEIENAPSPAEIPILQDEWRDKRQIFRGRHIQMMSLGASIGTGVLFESGNTLSIGGPVCLLLSYIWAATILYAVMTTLGEMISFLPIPGAIFTLAGRALCPAVGFASGIAYLLGYALDYPSKALAATQFVQYWTNSIPQPALLTIFLVVPIAFNLLNVRRYGEIEFYFTTIKIAMIVLLIILGILLPMGASSSDMLLGTSSSDYRPVECSQNEIGQCLPSHGFNYWRQAAFKTFLGTGAIGRFSAFWECSCRAAFTFTGNEVIGITADETERQRETLPKATKRISRRIIFYYLGAIFVLGLNVSANDPILPLRILDNPNTPYPGGFIVMLERANIPVLPSIVNAVMILAAFSVQNIDIYVASRSLYALVRERQAPSFFTRKNRFGVPWVAILTVSIPSGSLAYMGLKDASTDTFSFLSSTVNILLVWATICLAYLRLRRAIAKQQLERVLVPESLSRFQPFLAIYGFSCCTLLVLFQGYKVFTRGNPLWSQSGEDWVLTLAPYVFLGLFIALLLVARFMNKSNWAVASLRRVDITNGLAPLIKKLPPQGPLWKREITKVLDGI